MSRPLIAVTATDKLPVDLDEFRRALGEEYEVVTVPLPFGEMSLAERDRHWRVLREAGGIFVRTGVIPFELISLSTSLKVIALHGVGVDQVDVVAATEAGVYVTNVPGGNAVSVVELTFGLMLSLLRQIPRADRLVREGRWDEARTVGRELAGRRLGLVGYGNISAKVAAVAEAFGMEVMYWSRTRRGGSVTGRYVELPELFAQSDIVSLHIPLTEETRGFINRRLLSLMKPSAVLINTARGAVVNERDLLQALAEKWFSGAGLDVFCDEPLPADSPFLRLDNVVLTPHMAGSTEECLKRLASVAGSDIRRVMQGIRPVHGVNDPWAKM